MAREGSPLHHRTSQRLDSAKAQLHPDPTPLVTMTSLFCCGSVKPYRPAHLLHEDKFRAFVAWADFPKDSSPSDDGADKVDLITLKPPYAIQLVQQVNYGPLESKRYFIPVEGKDNEFAEVVEDDLIRANFKKLNS